MPGLWGAGLLFFAVNCWILGIVVKDIGAIEGADGRGHGRMKSVGETVKKRWEAKQSGKEKLVGE